jgi:signal transduction histidine kinase
MEMHSDFDPASKTRIEQQRHRREILLACYQQFLGHDLPNRLVAAQGLARLLLVEVGPVLDADARTLLERLANQILQADSEARRLAATGRLWCDAAASLATPLTEVAREAIDETFLLCSGRSVGYDVEDAMPSVRVSRRVVRAVVVELLCNAIAATPADRPLHVRVTADYDGPRVACSIADDGPGIPAEMLARLDRMLNADGFDAVEGRGLFLVRQLVAGWSGALRLRSEAGRGTTVVLLFPPAG